MPRAPRICPSCGLPLRQGDDYRAIDGVRHHLACRPVAPGRPPTPRGRGARQVGGRVSAGEAEALDRDAARLGVSAFEVLRRARFGA